MDQATLDNHLLDGLSTHLLLLQRFVETKFIPKSEECCCSTTNSNLRQSLNAAEARLEANEWALKTHYRLFTEVKEDTRTLLQALVQVGERVQDVEATNVALRQEVAELKGRIEAVENQAERRDNRVNNQLDFTRASCGSLSRSVQELHRRNEVHSYNGELVWIIPDVRPKWAEARNNPDSFLSSPPFYTSPSGYKARIDLYLNGRGQDWDLNMSFFLVIMKGEYDPVCTWPFDHHVEFSLMGQGASTGNDVIVHLQPNPRDPAFARPVGGRNFPDDAQAHCAIPLINLRSRAYVDDDTLFVKVIVREK